MERRECCHFCELELPWKQLDEHQLVCGSRTELCRDCGRYVTLRDQAKHGLTCSDTVNGSGPPQTTSEKTANNSKGRIKGFDTNPNELPGHTINYYACFFSPHSNINSELWQM